MIRFSFRKKPLEGENALHNLIAPSKGLLKHPVLLLENLRYIVLYNIVACQGNGVSSESHLLSLQPNSHTRKKGASNLLSFSLDHWTCDLVTQVGGFICSVGRPL